MSPRSREDIEQFVRENGDREVWVGIANPKGTENDDNSTFLSESQLERICEFLPGVPLHIDHIVYDKETGEKIEPAGTVLGGYVQPTSGELYVAVVFTDNAMGRLARDIDNSNLGDVLKGFSIGSGFIKDTQDIEIISNCIKEISVCPVGARPGTEIRSKGTLLEFFEKGGFFGEEERVCKTNTSPSSDQQPEHNQPSHFESATSTASASEEPPAPPQVTPRTQEMLSKLPERARQQAVGGQTRPLDETTERGAYKLNSMEGINLGVDRPGLASFTREQMGSAMNNMGYSPTSVPAPTYESGEANASAGQSTQYETPQIPKRTGEAAQRKVDHAVETINKNKKAAADTPIGSTTAQSIRDVVQKVNKMRSEHGADGDAPPKRKRVEKAAEEDTASDSEDDESVKRARVLETARRAAKGTPSVGAPTTQEASYDDFSTGERKPFSNQHARSSAPKSYITPPPDASPEALRNIDAMNKAIAAKDDRIAALEAREQEQSRSVGRAMSKTMRDIIPGIELQADQINPAQYNKLVHAIRASERVMRDDPTSEGSQVLYQLATAAAGALVENGSNAIEVEKRHKAEVRTMRKQKKEMAEKDKIIDLLQDHLDMVLKDAADKDVEQRQAQPMYGRDDDRRAESAPQSSYSSGATTASGLTTDEVMKGAQGLNAEEYGTYMSGINDRMPIQAARHVAIENSRLATSSGSYAPGPISFELPTGAGFGGRQF